jgi:hypothetical protein
MKQEQWQTIPGYENYAASTEGRIKRLTPGPNTHIGQIKKCFTNPATGYSHTKLSGTLGKRSISIHRVVAETFLPPVEGKTEVTHINGDRQDNRVQNLRWLDAKEKMSLVDFNHYVRKIEAISPDGEVHIYPSIKGAADSIGVHPSGISNVLAGKVRTYKGWKFNYAPTETNKIIL